MKNLLQERRGACSSTLLKQIVAYPCAGTWPPKLSWEGRASAHSPQGSRDHCGVRKKLIKVSLDGELRIDWYYSKQKKDNDDPICRKERPRWLALIPIYEDLILLFRHTACTGIFYSWKGSKHEARGGNWTVPFFNNQKVSPVNEEEVFRYIIDVYN